MCTAAERQCSTEGSASQVAGFRHTTKFWRPTAEDVFPKKQFADYAAQYFSALSHSFRLKWKSFVKIVIDTHCLGRILLLVSSSPYHIFGRSQPKNIRAVAAA